MTVETVDVFLSSPYGGTPHERVYWSVLGTAITKVAQTITKPRLRVLSAAEEISALEVKENVRELIDRCDFTIAVITGNNPNVFWEVGYTESQGKPVVYLLDEEVGDLGKSPVLVVEALKCAYRSSQVQNIVEEGKLPDGIAKRLEKFLIQGINAVKATPEPRKFATFSRREDCNLPELVSEAIGRIYLITTNLSYFADFGHFTAVQGKEVFAFDPPIEQGVDVKILTLDPESPIVKYRAVQLGFEHDVRRYREELRESARKFYQRYRDRDNVIIHLYDDLPLQITLIVDDQVMTSVMSRGSRSRFNLHVGLDVDVPGAKDSFEKHFFEVAAGPSRHISSFKWAQ